MIFSVPYPAHASADRSTEHGEDIGPFATAAFPCLEESPDVAVARKALVGAAVVGGTAVELDAEGAVGGFIGCGGRHALGDCG